jgi:hypothetical protein
MGQVIHVDFATKNPHDNGLAIYLNYLREIGLDEDDVLDVQDAILDKDHYFDADEVIQKFADDWFNKFE